MANTMELSSVGTYTRRGYNMSTWSGKAFWPLDPHPDDIRITDIARALSMQCRFNGHLKKFYSVAQHSVWVSEKVPAGFEMEGLLHDASETYIGDLIRPVKYQCPDFINIEKKIETALAIKFDLPLSMSPEVKKTDTLALWTEKRDLLSPHDEVDWGPVQPAHPDPILPVGPEEAEKMFLRRFEELGGRFD